MTTNIQSFAGDVEIPGNLQVKRLTVEDAITALGANNTGLSNVGLLLSRQANTPNVAVYYDETTNELRIGHTFKGGNDTVMEIDSANNVTMNVFGDVECNFIRADGGLLSNIASDLQSVTTYGANTDFTVTLSNVTTGLIVDSNVVVTGNITAGSFIGDGSQLDGIAANFEEIIINGNNTANTVEFRDTTLSLLTYGSVGVKNTAPGHDLSVGANLYVEELGSNVLTVEGNVSAHKMTLGTIEITPAYSLQQVTGVGNSTSLTVEFTNTSTAFVTDKMAGIGIAPSSADVGVSGLHVDGHIRLGGAAGTDENQDLYIKTAAQLQVHANDSDLDEFYTGAVLKSGVSNAGYINVFGAATDTNYQYIAFGVKNTEMMRINNSGNIGIGTGAPSYKLDVSGTSNASAYYQNSKLVQPQRKWDIDLTAYSTSNFYPVELKSSSLFPEPFMEPVHFKVYGSSLAGNDSYNENTLVGYARGGGWSDHQAMYDVHIRRYEQEIRTLGVYTGATNYLDVVIYVRGGYKYAVLTDAINVVAHTGATSYIPDSTGSVFAVKDVDGNDVSGTSANVVLQVDLTDTSKNVQRYTSGSTYVTNSLNIGNSTHVPNASLVTGDLNTMLGSSTAFMHNLTYDSGWKYVNANDGGFALRFENSRMEFMRAGTGGTAGGAATMSYDMIISNTGNVCIGGNFTPSYKLHVEDTIYSAKTLAPGTISTSVTRNDAKFLMYDINSTNWSGMGTDSAGRFWLTTGTNGTRELFVMDAGGNVGIGTQNPDKGNLSVYGLGADPYFTGFSEGNYADATDFTGLAHFHSSGSHGVIRISNSVSKTGSTRIDFNTTLGDYWGLNSSSASYFRGTAPTAGRIMVHGEIDNNYEDSYMTFHTCRDLRVDGQGGTGNLYERMRITSEGYVGIGTSPLNYLHVNAPNPYVDGLSVQGNDVQMVLGNRHGGITSATIQVFGTVTSSKPTTASNKYTLELNPLGGEVRVNTSSASASVMTVGNHSIGSDALQTLYLNGRRANADGAFAQLYFRNSSDTGAKYAAIQAEREGNNFGTKLRFFTHDTSGNLINGLTVNQAGQVGIGSSIPGAVLDVNGVVESPICKRNGTAATTTYNYILNGPRPGETGGGAVHFINGSGRTADGGASAYTIRNDAGVLNLGHVNSGTRLLNQETYWVRGGRVGTTIVGGGVYNASGAIVVPYSALQGWTGQWNATTNEYTCPFSGDYLISASFMAYPSSANVFFAWMQIRRKDSSGVVQDWGEQISMDYVDHTTYRPFTGTQSHACSAGDKIDVVYYIQSHTNQTGYHNLHAHWGGISIHAMRRTTL